MRAPFPVEIGWNVVDAFILQWQRNPYFWEKEFDVKAELAGRLRLAFELTNLASVAANYPDALPGFENSQQWSRVSCDPKTLYRDEDDNLKYCFPDVVILDQYKDPDSPPDSAVEQWPFLWACEIKLDWEADEGWDLDKLRLLIQQGVTQYGCWLRFVRKRAASGSGIELKSENGKIRVYEVKLPSLAA